mmetsp:Transcript_27539/g.44809  ORF Transcript_27539/g.44809 Transcript_27539/m.44809 type:complete len:268 (+) Transcript_27539:47-850(+)
MMPPPYSLLPKRLGFSFGGSGHLLVYHLGVAHSLLRHKTLMKRIKTLGGSSGGAIAAVAMACSLAEDHSSRQLSSFLHSYAKQCQSLSGLEAIIPEDSTAMIFSPEFRPKLEISVTDCKTGENVLVSGFKNRKELIQAVRASCHIPSSFHPVDMLKRKRTYALEDGLSILHMPGTTYADGGLSEAIPDLQLCDQTVKVSPISGQSGKFGICPESFGFRIGRRYFAGQKVDLSFENLKRLNISIFGDEPNTLCQLSCNTTDNDLIPRS